MSQDHVTTAINEGKFGKSCGNDGIVDEHWHAAVSSDSRIAAALAWDWNRRQQNAREPSTPAARPSPPPHADAVSDAHTCSVVRRTSQHSPKWPAPTWKEPDHADFWKSDEVRLLSKLASPTEFRFLRPISLLVTRCGRQRLTMEPHRVTGRSTWACKDSDAASSAPK